MHLHISIQKLTDQDEAPKENLGSACTLLKLNKYRLATLALFSSPSKTLHILLQMPLCKKLLAADLPSMASWSPLLSDDRVCKAELQQQFLHGNFHNCSMADLETEKRPYL